MTAGERTEDGRYIVIDGRRWRASDPQIPEKLRAELVSELMSARRLVKSEGDAVRHRVNDAKVALGERGEPWWEPTDEGRRDRMTAAYRALLRHRQGTVCPSEVARIVGGDHWRSVSTAARHLAFDLADSKVVVITQKGEEVGRDARGPIRVGRGPRLSS